MSNDAAIQPDDDLSKSPEDLNDFHAWFRRGEPGLAFEALLNQVAVLVGTRDTVEVIVKQLRADQSARDEQQATRLEQIVYGLKTDLKKSQNDFQEQLDNRFKTRDKEFDAFTTLVEERLSPLAELPGRLGAVEASQQQIIERLDADEHRLDVKRQRLDDHQARIAALEAAQGQRIDPQIRRLLIYGFLGLAVVVILVNVVLWWL